jgi:hypothetical protein
MEKFDKTRPCPKCGNAGAATGVEYHAANEEYCDLESGEHMHRNCHNCRYEWAEAPLS